MTLKCPKNGQTFCDNHLKKLSQPVIFESEKMIIV